MAIKIGDAVLYIGADSSRLNRELKLLGKSFERNVKPIIEGMAKYATVALGSIAGMLAFSLKKAIDAQETENYFKQSLGRMEADARAWSMRVSKELGLRQYELRKNMADTFVQLKGMGEPDEQALKMSEAITTLAYDMAKLKGMPVEEMLMSLRRGLSGQAKGLKLFGIDLSNDAVKAYALSHHLGTLTSVSETNRQEMALATKEYQGKRDALMKSGELTGEQTRKLELLDKEHVNEIENLRQSKGNIDHKRRSLETLNAKYEEHRAELSKTKSANKDVGLELQRLDIEYQKNIAHLGKQNMEMSAADKVSARFAMVMEKTKYAQGYLKDHLGVLKSMWTWIRNYVNDALIQIGMKLIPKATELTQQFKNFIQQNGDKYIERMATAAEKLADSLYKVVQQLPAFSNWLKDHKIYLEIIAGLYGAGKVAQLGRFVFDTGKFFGVVGLSGIVAAVLKKTFPFLAGIGGKAVSGAAAKTVASAATTTAASAAGTAVGSAAGSTVGAVGSAGANAVGSAAGAGAATIATTSIASIVLSVLATAAVAAGAYFLTKKIVENYLNKTAQGTAMAVDHPRSDDAMFRLLKMTREQRMEMFGQMPGLGQQYREWKKTHPIGPGGNSADVPQSASQNNGFGEVVADLIARRTPVRATGFDWTVPRPAPIPMQPKRDQVLASFMQQVNYERGPGIRKPRSLFDSSTPTPGIHVQVGEMNLNGVQDPKKLARELTKETSKYLR